MFAIKEWCEYLLVLTDNIWSQVVLLKTTVINYKFTCMSHTQNYKILPKRLVRTLATQRIVSLYLYPLSSK